MLINQWHLPISQKAQIRSNAYNIRFFSLQGYISFRKRFVKNYFREASDGYFID